MTRVEEDDVRWLDGIFWFVSPILRQVISLGNKTLDRRRIPTLPNKYFTKSYEHLFRNPPFKADLRSVHRL